MASEPGTVDLTVRLNRALAELDILRADLDKSKATIAAQAAQLREAEAYAVRLENLLVRVASAREKP